MDFAQHAELIVITSFFSSIISSLTGMGGGFILLIVLASFLPPAVVIPLHGALQLISNVFRISFFFRYINGSIVGLFSAGAVAGAFVGRTLMVEIPEDRFRLFIGFGVLIMTWLPKSIRVPGIKGLFAAVGAGSTFLSIFVGTVAPLTAPFFLRAGLIKEHLVATKSACQIPLHVLKLAVYFSAGFLISPWLTTLAAAIPAMLAGVWTGKALLKRIPEQRFYLLLQIIITALSLRVICLTLIS